MPLADSYDALLLDLDGVVWRGHEAVPGSPEALAELAAAGKRQLFLTNNPTRRPEVYAERLRGIGVAAEPDQIVTAGVVIARLAGAEAAGRGAFVIGSPALHEMVAEAGATPVTADDAGSAAVVVVSSHGGFDYEELRAAKRALDAGAALLATSRDPTLPMPGGDWPGTGAVLAAVETASGRTAEIAGKPERHMYAIALERLGPVGPERVAMIGDRVSSDVAGGRAAGLGTILVLSGATDSAEAAAADPAPDHVLPDLAAILR